MAQRSRTDQTRSVTVIQTLVILGTATPLKQTDRLDA